MIFKLLINFMATYKFRAIGKSGEQYEGIIDAPDRFAVYRKIKKEGGTILFVNEVKKDFSFLKTVRSAFGGIKTYEKIIFARNLGAMIEAGLAVTRALGVMEKQTKKKKLKELFYKLNEEISHGKSLSDSLKQYSKIFSPLFISMVKAGEESGNLASSLKTVASQMDRSYALSRKVRGALIYPAVILSVMIVIGILMMIYMVPTLSSTFQGLGVELPATTRAIIAISDFLRTQFILFVSIVVVLIASVLTFFRSQKGKRIFDFLIIKLPLIGSLVKEVNSARTARTLSSLLSSGVEVVSALSVTAEVLQNSYYKEVLKKAESVIQKGEAISSIFIQNEKLYPIFVGEMIAVGEETGKLSDMLLGVATFYEEEVDQKTKNLSTIIEPVLMVIIGVAVAVFAISMLMPTYSLVDKI